MKVVTSADGQRRLFARVRLSPGTLIPYGGVTITAADLELRRFRGSHEWAVQIGGGTSFADAHPTHLRGQCNSFWPGSLANQATESAGERNNCQIVWVVVHEDFPVECRQTEAAVQVIVGVPAGAELLVDYKFPRGRDGPHKRWEARPLRNQILQPPEEKAAMQYKNLGRARAAKAAKKAEVGARLAAVRACNKK